MEIHEGVIMMIRQIILVMVCLTLLTQHAAGTTGAKSQSGSPIEVTFNTEDGIKIWADIYLTPKGKEAPLIMLFHQGGGDARGEYAPIVPRLLQQGFNVIAIDQRKGGDRFDMANRTVANLKGQEFSYCDAYKDLEATLRYVKKEGFTGKRLAWGSSYSATLAIRLGSDYPNDLAGVLAFSPAGSGPMESCKPDPYILKLKLPALVLRPASEMETESAKQQLSLFQKNGQQTYIANNGVHGSSMLSRGRVNGDVEEHWKRVLLFIKQALAQ
jgi:alpha-beta hydrolase superfamily lysophospholipase